MGPVRTNIKTKQHLQEVQKKRIKLYLPLLNFFLVVPAHADAGKIFDFNATLPVMAIQFLLLMIFLEKTWFGPVGELLDKRNEKILARVKSLTSGTEELDSIQHEAESLLKEARAEAKAKIAEAKAELAAKAETELYAEKRKLDGEI